MYIDPDQAPVARYGFKILEVEGRYALLRVWLNESTSSLSCLVWVDIETGNLVDRETGEVWGRCPFWIYPTDVERKDVVAVSDLFGRRIVWQYFTLPPSSYDYIQAVYGLPQDGRYVIEETEIEIRLGDAGYLHLGDLQLVYNYHADKGLLLFTSNYADDILIKSLE